jgi:hypothetical protein
MMLRCYSSAVAGRYCMVTGSSAIRRISGTNAKAIRQFSSSWNWSPSQDKTTSAAGITTVASPAQVDSNIQTEVLDQCAELHSSIMPLNDQVGNVLAITSPRLYRYLLLTMHMNMCKSNCTFSLPQATRHLFLFAACLFYNILCFHYLRVRLLNSLVEGSAGETQ